ncbi:MAG: hypothetical protein WA087_03935 [Candidatus Saccharimonadales bacterium]
MKLRLIIFLAIFLATSAAYFLMPEAEVISTGVLYLVFPVGAALIGLYASRIYGFNSANGRALILITGGLVCWGVAEIITYVLDNFLTDFNTFPSIDNAFLLLASPIFGAGIYQGYVTAGIKLKLVKKSLLAMVLSASLILTVLVVYFGIYLVYDPEADILSNIVLVGLGLSDLVLIILSLFTILVASEYKGGKLASFWKTMALGFFLFLIADVWFAIYGNIYTEDIYGILIELTWIAGYMVLAFGMLENYLHISAVQKKIKLKLSQIN